MSCGWVGQKKNNKDVGGGENRVENRIRRNTFSAIDFINFLMDFTFSTVEDFNISDKYLCVGEGWCGQGGSQGADTDTATDTDSDLERCLLLATGLCVPFL